MTTVRNTVVDPAGQPTPGATVRIRLIAGPTGPAPGYRTTSTVLGTRTLTTGPDGTWTADIPANSTITPADTYYQVVETPPNSGDGYVSYIEVPASGGPYDLTTVLVATPTPPGGLAPVTSVNAATGAVTLDSADVDAVGLGGALTVPEASTVTVNRATMSSPGTAGDVLRFTYNSQRTGYANEYGLLRSRGAADQVAFRCQSHSSDDGTSQTILDVTLSDNTSMMSVDAHGDLYVTRDIILAGTTLSAPSAWTAPASYGTGIAGSAGSPHYAVGARLDPFGIVRLRGRINTTTAVSYVADATICTLASGHRPAATCVYTLRSGGQGAANGFITIASSGAVSFSQAISLTTGQTAWWQLDGLSFPTAA